MEEAAGELRGAMERAVAAVAGGGGEGGSGGGGGGGGGGSGAAAAAVHLAAGARAVLGLQAGLRKEAVRLEEARARALGARERRDAAHVLLQNVEYEVQHYERQIRTRKRFRSKFSEEEVGVAGEEGSSAEILERLKRELSDRRRLKARVEALAEEKDALRGKVTEELDTLKSWERDFRALAGGAALLREAVKEAPPASPSLGEGKPCGGRGTGEGAQGGDGTS